MNTTAARQPQQKTQTAREGWRLTRWKWQSVAAVLLALVVVEGQSAASTYAASGLAARAADAARRVATPVSRSATSTPATADLAPLLKADQLPDFRVAFARVDDGQAGMPLSYTLQVRNEGPGSGPATVSTLVPRELSNVRVSASGFACTRRFAASGAEAGTQVTCTRNDLDPGEAAELTIEANASTQTAEYRLTATADPRDEIAEADELNNEAGATLRIRS
jgi:hypothetical protein